MISFLENFFGFICGLGMFLYGTHLMSESMQKVFSNNSKNYLEALTSNRFMGIIVGIVVTIITNSSAATTVMVIGFVNAGLMELKQAVGVIMGANIGTTATAWLISLMELGSTSKLIDLSFYAPVVLGISAMILVFSKKDKIKNKLSIAVGIGFLFLGLSFMSDSVKTYSQAPILVNSFKTIANFPILGLLLGMIVTAILQSSTASMSILQALTLTGNVSKIAAVFIILGQNIGTCVTALLSSLSANKNAKKTALIHLFFNVVGAVICILVVIVIYPFLNTYLLTNITLLQISIFHTLFNLCNTIILFPFSELLIKLIDFLMKDDQENEDDILYSDRVSKRLDKRTLEQPLLAFDTARHVVVSYLKFVYTNFQNSIKVILDEKDEELVEEIFKAEDEIDKSNYKITDYLAVLNTKPLNDKQHSEVDDMLSMCSDIERIGDHCENLAENAKNMYENNVIFTEDAMVELKEIANCALKSVEYAIDCIENRNIDSIEKTINYETKVDELRDTLKEKHIKRMNEGKCNTRAGIIFFEIISNLERVSDHARNLSDYLSDSIKKYKK